MRDFLRFLCVFVCLLLTVLSPLSALAESATPEEVVAKVTEAAAYVAQGGEAVFPEFNDPKGKWAWKDTYVFVYRCSDMLILAHPSAKLIGLEPEKIKDAKGAFISMELCGVVEDADSGWAEYYWPKVGEENPSRKVTYMRKVPGTPYTVGAGIYSESVTAEELNAKMK